MLKQLQDENGNPLYDSNGKPLMYESTADEPADETPSSGSLTPQADETTSPTE